MKDRGLVIKTTRDLADVEVECLTEACGQCAAKSLCSGRDQSKPRLTVKNPLRATAGDRVEIEIPENKYNTALIFIFTTLILASLLGIAIGYIFSLFFPVPSQEASILGLILFLGLAAGGLFRYFNKKNRGQLYPVIINIIKEGD